MTSIILVAATLLSLERGGVDLKVESETAVVDPAKSVFLTLTLRTPRGVDVAPPDLRGRVRGFSLAEDFADEPVVGKDGSKVQVVNWKLVPEPCASVYKIAPFAVAGEIAGPVYFEPPPAPPAVTGGMEVDPRKDLPPLSWKLVGWIAGALACAAILSAGVWWLARFVARRIREHRMSPIERAWVELDRLLKKGLPGRGRYKDFYVELTMVVRRYVQRKYGIRAPHLTTEEFLGELAGSRFGECSNAEGLRAFLESADMVKFAGVQATPEMADGATESARGYLKSDAASVQDQRAES
jgi:hypothetical protein